MFEYLTAAPADPILGLADLYNKDERTNKINLSVGVYKDETTKTPILESVKKAEQFLLTDETRSEERRVGKECRSRRSPDL